MEPILWVGLLLLFGIVLAVVEIFVPSGGLLGVLCLMSVTAAIILAFYMGGPTTGFSFMIVAGVALPAVIGFGLKIWPNTRIGRRILLDIPDGDEVKPNDFGVRELIGKIGRAKTMMVLSGSIEIDGKIIDAISEGTAIEKGQWVKVIDVRGNRVIVRPTDNKLDKTSQVDNPLARGDDILSKGIDELGLDDPLG